MRDNRFALISMGRPFVPTMATPDGTIDKDARLQLAYMYLLAGAGIPLAHGLMHVLFTSAAPKMTFRSSAPKATFTAED